MKRVWPLAYCMGVLMACHPQQQARPEVWPPSKEPAPVVAHAPAPPPKVLDPTEVELSDRTPVMQARHALEKGNPGKAREIAEAAVGTASAQDKGRLHWLAAQAAAEEGYAQIAIAHFDALSTFRHPLAKWATLRRAMLLERRDPHAAAALVATLDDVWGGQERAAAIAARLNPKGTASPARPTSPAAPSARGRSRQTMSKAQSLYD
ncbi:MAG: hypothetical protein WBG86_17695, partial [Polyangiales bacterium]